MALKPECIGMPARPLWIALVATGAIGAAIYLGRDGEPTMEDVAEMVRQLNDGLPAMADAATRLDSVTLGEGEIVYKYSLVDYSSFDLRRDQMAALLRPQFRKAACSAAMMKPLWRAGYSARYRVYGKNKQLVTEVVLRPHDCGLASLR
jgi:hypothetical protein